jgi:hypothetical protein
MIEPSIYIHQRYTVTVYKEILDSHSHLLTSPEPRAVTT